MKPYGDCCTVALRKQRQLLLQHMTKPSLSDRPSQAGAAAPGGKRRRRSRRLEPPPHLPGPRCSDSLLGVGGDPLLPPSLLRFSPLATQGTTLTGGTHAVLVRRRRPHPPTPNAWFMFPQVDADPEGEGREGRQLHR